MDVPSFCADVQPLTLEGQVAESYSVKRKENRHEQKRKKVARMTEEEEVEGWTKQGEVHTDSGETDASLKNHSTSHYNETNYAKLFEDYLPRHQVEAVEMRVAKQRDL